MASRHADRHRAAAIEMIAAPAEHYCASKYPAPVSRRHNLLTKMFLAKFLRRAGDGPRRHHRKFLLLDFHFYLRSQAADYVSVTGRGASGDCHSQHDGYDAARFMRCRRSITALPSGGWQMAVMGTRLLGYDASGAMRGAMRCRDFVGAGDFAAQDSAGAAIHATRYRGRLGAAGASFCVTPAALKFQGRVRAQGLAALATIVVGCAPLMPLARRLSALFGRLRKRLMRPDIGAAHDGRGAASRPAAALALARAGVKRH